MGCGAVRGHPPRSAAVVAASSSEKKEETAHLLETDGDARAVPPKSEPLAEEPPRAANKSGVSLKSIEQLRNENLEWLESKSYNEFAHVEMRPTMYDVVPQLIKPRTAHRKCSFAELFPEASPHVFVSHWWGEEFVLFVSALRKFAEAFVDARHGLQQKQRQGDNEEVEEEKHKADGPTDPGDVFFWVCSLANRQWHVNLGSTLEESPFEIALADQGCQCVVMVMDPNATPLSRIWCLYEVLRTHLLEKPFHIATENGILTLGKKEVLGKEREDLLNLCQKVLEIDADKAVASRDEDRRIILAAIQRAAGVEQFSLHLKSLLLDTLIRRGGPQLMADVGYLRKQLLALQFLKNTFVFFGPRSRLHQLAQHGTQKELMDIVKDKQSKLDINAALGNGQTPLHLAAAFNKDPAILRLLIAADAEMDCPDNAAMFPLGAAALRGQTEAVKLLLESRANVNASAEHSGKDPTFFDGFRDPLVDAIIGSHEEGVALMLEARAEVHSMKLVLCCHHNNATILRAVLKQGGLHPDGEEDRVRTPLTAAAQFGNSDCVEALLEARADVNRKTRTGMTALMGAAGSGHLELAQKFLDCGADLLAEDHEKRRAFDFACGGGFMDVVRLLLEKRADIDHRACHQGFLPIHTAAMWGRPKVVRFLVEQGSEIDPLCLEWGQTPLMYGAENGYTEVVQTLIGLQADINLKDFEGRTALGIADVEGFTDCVELLLDAHDARDVG